MEELAGTAPASVSLTVVYPTGVDCLNTSDIETIKKSERLIRKS